jgi:hypothetical protein
MMAIASALSGCGDSTPLPQAGHASVPSGAATSMVANTAASRPESGTFAVLANDKVDAATRISPDCNLDAIDDKSATNVTLARGSTSLFSGWVADTSTGSVPVTAKLVLRGAQDFAINLRTGNPKRVDVANAMKHPSFVDAGYQIRGDVAAVSAGSYSVSLLSVVAGQTLRCDTSVSVTVGK